jgi:hypothetical protein
MVADGLPLLSSDCATIRRDFVTLSDRERTMTLTHEELTRRLDAIFAKQDADAAEKRSSPMYPPSVASDVLRASVAARGVVGRIQPGWTAHAFLAAAVVRVADAHERWRSEEEDEDGFGSATFHEIRRDLDALLRESE